MTDVGDRVTLSWVLGQSATVALTVTLPDGTTTTPSVTGSSTYSASLTTTQPGLHVLSWLASGAYVAAHADVLYVDPASPQGIVSLDEVKGWLKVSGTASDDALRELILDASDICERRTGSTWRRTTVTAETRNGRGETALRLRRSPVTSVTTVTESGITLAAGTDYVLDAETGTLYRGDATSALGWESGRQNLVVTYIAGPSDGVVPGHIRRGLLLQIQHMWETQRGGSGGPRQASTDYEVDPRTGWQIPRRVLEAWQLTMPILVG